MVFRKRFNAQRRARVYHLIVLILNVTIFSFAVVFIGLVIIITFDLMLGKILKHFKHDTNKDCDKGRP